MCSQILLKNNFKITENFLSKKKYLNIYNAINNEYFPWYYNNYKLNKVTNKLFDYQLTHVFYNNGAVNSTYFNIIEPLIKKLKVKTLIKIKANLNPISQELIEFGKHEDTPTHSSYRSMIYYLNTNNGYTKIKNKKIKSKENKALFFPSSTIHQGTNSTNCNNRMVINIIYVV
jgi:mannose-6-phosphate isomerase-like protein (cupin superfamily)|tara:strand:- start:290 stop:808 length:519 start_codon:yes stop_codon:yes gene_type:complete